MKASQIEKWMKTASATEQLTTLYGKRQDVVNYQQQRYATLAKQFIELFGDADVSIVSTPGRTEIGGNHTDHNHGRVLAASVNLDSIAVITPTEDNTVVFHSDAFDAPFCVDLSDLTIKESEIESTAALIRGIAARFSELGHRIGGFQACMSSDVLIGSGLSSSASVEVLIGTIFNTLYNGDSVSPEQLALIGQFAENHYFGKPCGLMDQMTCAVGGIVTIDFEHPKEPVVKKVAFDFASQGYQLVVVDTGGSHADLTDDYASIPREMKAVASVLGGQVGRDVSLSNVIDAVPQLREKVGDRAILRLVHFLMDNERVVQQVAALAKGDFYRFLELVLESGRSSYMWLQNCFSTKVPQEQGIPLALMLTEHFLSDTEHVAWRVHGGGFAGTIQVFLPVENVDAYVRHINKTLGGQAAKVLTIRPEGTRVIHSHSKSE